MAIDWTSEDFVRLYKRDTDDDLLLSWEAEATWHKFLKRCDKSGLLETRRGARGLAALLRIPLDVIERVLQELIEDGRIRSIPDRGFWAPNYVAANYVARSDKARQAQSRLAKRVKRDTGSGAHQGDGDCDGSVSDHENQSRDVTSSHDESQNHHNNTTQINAPNGARAREGRFSPIPVDWQPGEECRQLADKLGLDFEQEAKEFHTHWLGDGKPKKDWNLAFQSRLLAQAGRRKKPGEEVRNVDDM